MVIVGNSAQFSDWVRIGTVSASSLANAASYSAQFSDWVRIGTILRASIDRGYPHSAQFSDWVRIGTLTWHIRATIQH